MAKAMSETRLTSPSAEGIAASARAAGGAARGLPPVHLWNPPYQGMIDMRIARDGTWYHEGGAINRPALVRLFSTILRRDEDRYVLVTPVECVGITVEDVPFIAVDFEVEGAGRDQVLAFETNVGDITRAGPEAAIRVSRGEDGEPAPYVMVRAGLEARIDRKSFYRMVELGEEHAGWFGVWSGGVFFALIEAAEMQEG